MVHILRHRRILVTLHLIMTLAQSTELYYLTSYNSSLLCRVENVEFSDYSCEVKIKTIFK